jgi:hypothetical protein
MSVYVPAGHYDAPTLLGCVLAVLAYEGDPKHLTPRLRAIYSEMRERADTEEPVAVLEGFER